MATVTDTRLTFLDIQRQLDPTGTKLMPVAEVLNQVNMPLQDGALTKSNADTGHRVTIRTGMPAVSTGKVDKGITKSKSTTSQLTETMAMFVGRSEIDVRNKDIYGETKYNMKRATENIVFLEKFSQFIALQFLYGSVAADEGTFDGVATRMPNLAQPAPGSSPQGPQVWNHAATVAVSGGDGASIYIVDWNPDRGVHWIYPEESTSGGLQVRNHESVPVLDVDNNSFFADVSEFIWYLGLAVEDPRRIARMANIDVSDANLGAANTQGYIVDNLIDIIEYMPSDEGMNRVMYAHPRILAGFWKQIMNKTAPLYLTEGEYLGKRSLMFAGYPLRRIDQASISEGTVS